jgi:hypothetical protein
MCVGHRGMPVHLAGLASDSKPILISNLLAGTHSTGCTASMWASTCLAPSQSEHLRHVVQHYVHPTPTTQKKYTCTWVTCATRQGREIHSAVGWCLATPNCLLTSRNTERAGCKLIIMRLMIYYMFWMMCRIYSAWLGNQICPIRWLLLDVHVNGWVMCGWEKTPALAPFALAPLLLDSSYKHPSKYIIDLLSLWSIFLFGKGVASWLYCASQAPATNWSI